ncbi:MAG: hypothetical protein LIO77_00485 [Rikenellaceae bacterium]|nr:hypothetical protein [Rikenellaceae bacterium]
MKKLTALLFTAVLAFSSCSGTIEEAEFAGSDPVITRSESITATAEEWGITPGPYYATYDRTTVTFKWTGPIEEKNGLVAIPWRVSDDIYGQGTYIIQFQDAESVVIYFENYILYGIMQPSRYTVSYRYEGERYETIVDVGLAPLEPGGPIV